MRPKFDAHGPIRLIHSCPTTTVFSTWMYHQTQEVNPPQVMSAQSALIEADVSGRATARPAYGGTAESGGAGGCGCGTAVAGGIAPREPQQLNGAGAVGPHLTSDQQLPCIPSVQHGRGWEKWDSCQVVVWGLFLLEVYLGARVMSEEEPQPERVTRLLPDWARRHDVFRVVQGWI